MTAARHKGQFAFFVICTAFAFALEFKLKTCVDADFECDGSNFCLTCAETLMIEHGKSMFHAFEDSCRPNQVKCGRY